jgi:hypothetical protein
MDKEITLMVYSMRTSEYRYNAYFYMNRSKHESKLKLKVDTSSVYAQELYDHKNESLSDFTKRETVNIAGKTLYASVISKLHAQLVKFIETQIIFHDPKV